MTLSGAVARYADAWNDHDAAACAACFTPDGYRLWCVRAPAHLATGPRHPRFDGRAAIEQGIASFMLAVPDLRLEVEALSEGSDERVWTEWRVTGTHEERWGAWEARGEPVDFVGVSIFRVEPGGLAEERVYWDSLLMTEASPGVLTA